MYRALWGHTSTQRPQNMQRPISNSILSTMYLFPPFFDVSICIMPWGQLLAQVAQPVHRSALQTNCWPLARRDTSSLCSGYWVVIFFLNRCLRVNAIPWAIPSPVPSNLNSASSCFEEYSSPYQNENSRNCEIDEDKRPGEALPPAHPLLPCQNFQGGNVDIYQRHRQQELPGERHNLVYL